QGSPSRGYVDGDHKMIFPFLAAFDVMLNPPIYRDYYLLSHSLSKMSDLEDFDHVFDVVIYGIICGTQA
ncbi:hypothetical protein L9F63_004423, partial [Diploptera punctata]